MKNYEGKINEKVDSMLKDMGFESFAVANFIKYRYYNDTSFFEINIDSSTLPEEIPFKIFQEGQIITQRKIKQSLDIY